HRMFCPALVPAPEIIMTPKLMQGPFSYLAYTDSTCSCLRSLVADIVMLSVYSFVFSRCSAALRFYGVKTRLKNAHLQVSKLRFLLARLALTGRTKVRS